MAHVVAAVTFTDETPRHEEAVRQLAEGVARVGEGNFSASDGEGGQAEGGAASPPGGEPSDQEDGKSSKKRKKKRRELL